MGLGLNEALVRLRLRAPILLSTIMPYKIVHSGNGFKVAKKHGGKTFSKKPLTKKKAEAQMRAIYANEGSSINLIGLIEHVMAEAVNDVNGSGSNGAPGRIDAATQGADFLRFKGKIGYPSVGNKPLEIRVKHTDGKQVSNALRNAGIPFNMTDDGYANAYFIFSSEEQHRAAEQLLQICEDVDVNTGGPEEEEVFGREPSKVTNEPVGVTGPKQDLIRPAGGGARI